MQKIEDKCFVEKYSKDKGDEDMFIQRDMILTSRFEVEIFDENNKS